MNLSTVYEKVEKLALRLPPGLQTPILREVSPIKTLFLQQRPPRILLLGERSASRSALVNAIFGNAASSATEDHLQDGRWQTFYSEFGKLQVLDARRPVSVSLIRRAVLEAAPDLAVYLQGGHDADKQANEDLERLRELLALDPANTGAKPIGLFGVVADTESATAEASRHTLQALLESRDGHPAHGNVHGTFVVTLGPEEVHSFAAALAAHLPGEAKLEMARLSGVIELQRELAGLLIKSVAAVCGVVGAEPIPLADLPILTLLQSSMVAGIMDIAGRKMSPKLAGEFLAAVGANVGLGLLLRESSRAVLKLVPFWGSVVSGGIAAAGTYAIGRAASAYFIEGITLAEAQRIFRARKSDPAQLTGKPPEE